MDEFLGMSPLGVMYLSSSLKKAGHETKIVNVDYGEAINACYDFNPNFLAYSLTTGFQNKFIDLNNAIKKSFKKKVFSIFGGPHLTYFPETIAKEGIDAIAIGEGESAFVEFVNKFQEGKDITHVENIHVKQSGEIFRNEVRPLIENLDDLPFPNRDLILEYTKRANKFQTFITSRGCPYNCTYCFNATYRKIYANKGKIIRKRSVDNVLAEIEEVKNRLSLEHVSFQDDEFCSSDLWIEEFCAKYKDKIDIPFSCNLRPNLVTFKRVRMLKETGCSSITMAFEAGNDYVRNKILKRNLAREEMLSAAKIIREHNIFLNIQNMIGIPGGSLEKDLETLRLNIEANPDYAWVSLCSPYPRTELGEFAKKEGFFDGKIENFKPTFHYTSSLNIKNKKETENLHKLFAIVTRYPFMLYFLRFLLKLPLGALYNLMRKVFKGYVYYHKNRFTVRLTFREKTKYAFKFIRQAGG